MALWSFHKYFWLYYNPHYTKGNTEEIPILSGSLNYFFPKFLAQVQSWLLFNFWFLVSDPYSKYRYNWKQDRGDRHLLQLCVANKFLKFYEKYKYKIYSQDINLISGLNPISAPFFISNIYFSYVKTVKVSDSWQINTWLINMYRELCFLQFDSITFSKK